VADAGITGMTLGTTLNIQLYAAAAPATYLVLAKNAILPKIIKGESLGPF
jgi:hypothetical protein